MSISEVKDEYIEEFDSKDYLAEFFGEVDDECRFTIQFMINALQTLPSDMRILEFGGGPALHSVATLVPKACEIHFCDFVPANLAEVRAWLTNEPDAFDWTAHLAMILAAEGRQATPEAVMKRAAEIRQKVTIVTACDALEVEPLGLPVKTQYDLVVAHHCTDVAAATLSEWMRIIQNISTLVTANGWLLISVTTGSRLNTVGTKVFPCVDLSDEDIYQGYMTAGYDPATLRRDKVMGLNGREYSTAISAIARKLR